MLAGKNIWDLLVSILKRCSVRETIIILKRQTFDRDQRPRNTGFGGFTVYDAEVGETVVLSAK